MDSHVTTKPSATTSKSSIKQFLKSLQIEPLIFIVTFASHLGGSAYTQLKQDKICMNEFHMPEKYCLNLGREESSPVKNAILSKLATYSVYKEMMSVVPSLIMSVYIGSWCDSFQNARFYIFVADIVSLIVEHVLIIFNVWMFDWSVLSLLMASIPHLLMGHGFHIALLSFQAAHCKREDTSFRFLLIHLAHSSAAAVSTIGGAKLLGITKHGEMRNYTGPIVAQIVFYIIALIWTLVMLREDHRESSGDNFPEDPIKLMKNGIHQFNIEEMDKKDVSMIRKLFTLSHVKDSFYTLFRKRPNNLHVTLWWLLAYATITDLPHTHGLMFPLVERLYKWDYKIYMTIHSLFKMLSPVVTLVLIPVLFKYLILRDLQLSMVGLVVRILADIAIASITYPSGYYIYSFLGCFSTLASIGNKSFLTNILPKDEISKIYSAIGTIESMQPFIGAYFYNEMLKRTIDWYPTFCFHVTSFIYIFALCVVAYLDLLWIT